MKIKIFIALVFLFQAFAATAQAEIQTSEIDYKVDGAALKGFLAYDDSVKGKRPGVLVVHEWWGHNEHARNRAKMLAELGYAAFALDMYGTGKLAEHPEDAGKFMQAAFKNWEGSQARFKEAMKILKAHETVDAEHIGAIGFCFGGAVVIRMAKGGADLDGVAAFHAALPMTPTVSKGQSIAPILVMNGSDDQFLKPDQVGDFVKELTAANADITYMSLAGVKHSYTNPRADEFRKKYNLGALEYNKAADERAWSAMHSFFQRVFK